MDLGRWVLNRVRIRPLFSDLRGIFHEPIITDRIYQNDQLLSVRELAFQIIQRMLNVVTMSNCVSNVNNAIQRVADPASQFNANAFFPIITKLTQES